MMTNNINTDIHIQKVIKKAIKDGKQTIFSVIGYKSLSLRARPNIEKGNHIHGMANNIFAHAVLHGYVDTKPVRQIQASKALKTHTIKSHPALTKPHEFSCLLNDIEQRDNPR